VVGGVHGSLDVRKGEIMFAWAEFERLVEEAADLSSKDKTVPIKAKIKTVNKSKEVVMVSELDTLFAKKPKRK
jgi:hypothetical protein